MEDVEKVLKKNGIEPEKIESGSVSPEESRRNHVIEAENGNFYHLSFPINRETPCRNKTAEQRVKSEHFCFKKIREKTGLKAPEVVDTDFESYILVKEINGRQAIKAFKNMERNDKERFSRETGERLAEIHEIEMPEPGFFGRNGVEEKFGSWKIFFNNYLEEVYRNSSSKLEQKAAEYLKQNSDIIRKDLNPVFVYGDFQPWNLLTRKGNIHGVIDGESCFAGNKEYDLAQAAVAWSDKFDVSEEFLEGYRKNGKLEQGWEERHEYYRIYLLVSTMMDAKAIGWNELEKEFRERLGKRLE